MALCCCALVILATTSAVGCGNLTAGGGSGRLAITLTADAGLAGAAALGAPTGAALIASASGSSDEPEGEVEVEFDLILVATDGTRTRLNDDQIRARMDLRGRAEIDVVESVVDATSYDELRIVFREIKAEIEAGLVINGTPVVGEVRVEMDDASIEVARPLDLDIEDGELVTLLVDLSARAWLQAVDPATRTVDASAFAERIQVVER